MPFCSEGYLKGKLLVAMPGISDSRFHHAVVLLCDHDKDGASGLLINKPAKDADIPAVFKKLGLDAESAPTENPLLIGGPTTMERGLVLHSNDYAHTTTRRINGLVSVTGHADALKVIARDHSKKGAGNGSAKLHNVSDISFAAAPGTDLQEKQPHGPRLWEIILGQSIWSDGQLEEEILQNQWLHLDSGDDLFFSGPADALWEKCYAKLGVDPVMLAHATAPGQNRSRLFS